MCIAVPTFRILPLLHLIPFLTYRAILARSTSSFPLLTSSGLSDSITFKETVAETKIATTVDTMSDEQSQGLK